MKEDKRTTPLRIVLNNFLNHIEKLEAHRCPDDGYEKEFQDLKLFSENLKGLKEYASTEGEKEANRKKNRYKDILPFDFSRVVLSEYAGAAGSDYINANFIRGASGSPAYIASQGPLPHTVNDFWRMVVECEVHVIIMACNQDEAGKHKCEKYWVEREGEIKQFGMVRIQLIQGSSVCPDFSVRTIKLEYQNKENVKEERTVCQFHYSAWPDHGVPPSVRPLLDMVRLVRDTQASETLPVLVHCSAGCGRTGTICAIDYVWGLLRAGKLTKDFSLLTLVREMRRQRVAMVQTTEQYVLVHRAVRELFREQLRVIDSHPYENIDLNGALLHGKADEEPVYESLNSVSESQSTDKKVKESDDLAPAPPLPRKNRIHMAASKQEKEVENQTQKQRGNQGSPGGIAKLKAMFERSPVSRSQSLGRRQASNPPAPSSSSSVKPPPALPIKRSKSLRILGSGEKSKSSLAVLQNEAAKTSKVGSDNAKTKPPIVKIKGGPLLRRRRSFELNNSPKPVRRSLHLDDDGRKLLQDCKDFLAGSLDPQPDARQRIDSIVAGLGVRERRDSFRQAVLKVESKQTDSASQSRSIRDSSDVDEVDGIGLVHKIHQRPIQQHAETDDMDFLQPNVIIVKQDRLSPKLDLYVKNLPNEIASAAKINSVGAEKINGTHQDFPKQMWRAATSIDLKSNLKSNDLALQELKLCLRREGTAHELKLRNDDQKQDSYGVKLCKSLDRVPKREDVAPGAQSTMVERKNQSSSGSAQMTVTHSPHRSPQSTVERNNHLNPSPGLHPSYAAYDRRNQFNVHSLSPQANRDRRNPLNAAIGSHPSQSMDQRNAVSATSSPHHSPQTTVDRRNPLTATSSPHHSPQTTVDRRNAIQTHSSPHQSPQTTVDRRNPLTATSSPLHSPQTTVDRRNPINSHASPHHSPQTTVDRRNPPTATSSPHHSPQTTVDRRNPINNHSSPHHSPQTTVDRRQPIHSSSSPHRSPPVTVDRRNSLMTSSSPPSTVERHSGPRVSPQATIDRHPPSSPTHHPSRTVVEKRNRLSGPAQLISGITPGPPRSSMGGSNPLQSPQQSIGNSHLPQKGPVLYDKQQSNEPYSYGLVASVLRRGSQDDLALCLSGSANISPKLASNVQRPSAPPRIKRHASVALPRKNGGAKHPILSGSNILSVGQEQWNSNQRPKPVSQQTSALPDASSISNPAGAPNSVHVMNANKSITSPSALANQPAQSVAPSKTKSSPKKSAASSLSRALGALQLRRSGSQTISTSSITVPTVTSPITSRPSFKESQRALLGAGGTAAISKPLSHPSTTQGLTPSSALSPTLVITPTKPIMPPGILEETKTPPLFPSSKPPNLIRGPTHYVSAPQNTYPPRRNPPSNFPLQPHQLPHHMLLEGASSRPPFAPQISPQRLPFQHRHPHPSPQHYPHPSPHHVYPQHPSQHPKTHKKQQYL